MNIVIVGLGKVGETLAHQLAQDGNDIYAIDLDAKKIEDISNNEDHIMGFVGNGAVHSVQVEANIKDADHFIAVTGSDELNILCCIIAQKSGCRAIARVRDPEYSAETSFLKEGLDLEMIINPEYTAAREIARILRFPSAMKIDSFADGRVELLKFKLPENSILENTKVMEVVTKLRCDVLICLVERTVNGVTQALIPNGNFEIQSGDVLGIIASTQNAHAFFRKINYRTGSAKDVIVAGGGSIGRYLCRELVRDGVNVTLIEKDKRRSEELCTIEPDITVVNADATSKDLLMQYHVGEKDGFVALTNMDEENILLSLFAASQGKVKTIAKINRFDFDDIVKKLDLDTIIYPKNITADVIVRYVRAMKSAMGSSMKTLYSISRDQVEAAEFEITQESRLTDRPIQELKMRPETLIAAVLRGRKVIIPRGPDMLKVGDSVVIVTKMKRISDIEDILG
ncbi:MAG: Trk system potassium transporter TrkA [Oscillospiraceae bacterium]|nr:Trk system potassium transporter TrkA [Oscillospiraceae bacterium]